MGALAPTSAMGFALDPQPQRRDDRVDVVQHGLRVEADDSYTTGFEDGVAPSVVARAGSVGGAIDFDGEAERRAVEVYDKASDDVLSAELHAFELTAAQPAAEQGLGRRRVRAHLPG